MSLQVRAIDRREAVEAAAASTGLSYQQSPSWGEVNPGWASDWLGWFDEAGQRRGYALALRKHVPGSRRYLSYLPEGPVLDWDRRPLDEWLAPLAAHLQNTGALAVKMSPRVVDRSWSADTIRAAIKRGEARSLDEVAADDFDDSFADSLAAAGWRQQLGDSHLGVSDYSFELPITGRTTDELLAGLSSRWRRSIGKAERAGVEILHGGPGDLAGFYETYQETASRSHFPPQPLSYFTQLSESVGADAPGRFQLYLARHQGEVLGAAIVLRVGDYAGYGYGGSRTARRDVQPNTLLHWSAIRDAADSGAGVYDMRGIDDTLTPSHPKYGLLEFKLGTGGRAVRYVGEWDLVFSRPLYRAVQAYGRYLRRRG